MPDTSTSLCFVFCENFEDITVTKKINKTKDVIDQLHLTMVMDGKLLNDTEAFC